MAKNTNSKKTVVESPVNVDLTEFVEVVEVVEEDVALTEVVESIETSEIAEIAEVAVEVVPEPVAPDEITEKPDFGAEDTPIYPSEESDRIMWLRERFGLTPGKLYDAETISVVKSWERVNGFSGNGIINSELWSELFA